MTITKLRLINFQKHRRLSLNLDNKITTIVGSSDAGKSSIVRALYWLVFNKPRGEAFIRHGATYTKVVLELDDLVIERRRGKKNAYVIQHDGDKQEYVAFGSDVPDAVAVVLNMEAENFQLQHDSPFWLADSPAHISRELNRIVNLEVMDRVMANLAGLATRESMRLKIYKEEVAAARTERNALERVRAVHKDLTRLEDRFAKFQAIASKRRFLSLAVEEVSQYSEEAERLKLAVAEAESCVQAGRKAAELAERRDCLAADIKAISEIKSMARQKTPDFNGVKQAFEQATECRRRLDDLRRLIDGLEINETSAKKAKSDLKRVQEEIQQKTGGRCPLCHQPLSK